MVHMQPTTESLSSLYERDEPAWLERMSRLVAQRRFEQVDAEHLAEYLSDMALRDKREVFSRLVVLLAHLLKTAYQPDKLSKSWQRTVFTQRLELGQLLDARSLHRHASQVLPKAYPKAIQRAAIETGLPHSTFPSKCPWTLDQILAEPDAA